jgi:hypothetical protein
MLAVFVHVLFGEPLPRFAFVGAMSEFHVVDHPVS